MLFKCKLIDACLDCKNAHIDVFNELVRPSGAIIPETIGSTLYCKHQNTCSIYNDSLEGDHLVLVPLSHFMESYAEEEEIEEGDGINE